MNSVQYFIGFKHIPFCFVALPMFFSILYVGLVMKNTMGSKRNNNSVPTGDLLLTVKNTHVYFHLHYEFEVF